MQTMLTVTVKGDFNDTTKRTKRVINTNSDKYQRRAQLNLDVHSRRNIVSIDRKKVSTVQLST